MKPKKEREKKRSIFQVCFPCFSKRTVDCDDIMYNSFSKEFTEYEYIIENLAVRRAPKKLLSIVLVHPSTKNPPKVTKKKQDYERKPDKNISGIEVKKVPSSIFIGPVVEVENAVIGDSLLPTNKDCSKEKAHCGPCNPNSPGNNPCYLRYPSIKRPCNVCKTYYAETNLKVDHDLMKQILNTHSVLYESTDATKKQVLADIHMSNIEEEENKSPINIPSEIQETIEALKVAKPLRSNAPFPRNHRSLIRTASSTSCDKETICNFLDGKSTKEESADSSQNVLHSARAKRSPLSPRKPKTLSSISDASHFSDIIECDEKESSDLQSIEKAKTPDKSSKGQNLKWKIIINKHKKDKKI